MSFLGFGSRRRRSRKGGKGGKPSAKLVRMCKKYGVKVMRFGSRKTSFGSRRTKSYKKAGTLKKLCAKAIRRKIKQVKGQMKRNKKSSPRRRRRARFGGFRKTLKKLGRKAYKYKYSLGSAAVLGGGLMARRRYRRMSPIQREKFKYKYSRGYLGLAPKDRVGLVAMPPKPSMSRPFYRGGSRALRKPFKGANNKMTIAEAARAMQIKRFMRGGLVNTGNSYYTVRQGTRFGKRRRRYRFGNGGNPPLSASMGYEFCSNGGGVLGANSTGLFPTPCTPQAPAAAFGKRRRRRY